MYTSKNRNPIPISGKRGTVDPKHPYETEAYISQWTTIVDIYRWIMMIEIYGCIFVVLKTIR